MNSTSSQPKPRSRRWRLLLGLVLLPVLLMGGIGWYFTSAALFPGWQIEDLGPCPRRRIEGFGKECGDLRKLNELQFSDFAAPTDRGYSVPAWLLSVAAQKQPMARPGFPARHGFTAGRYAAIFAHGGGSDRREGYRLARYFLNRGFDYYMPDLVCHGLAACPQPGLSFGVREYNDLVDLVRTIVDRHNYTGVVLIGTSVGANSALLAFSELQRDARTATKLRAVIVENPMYSVQRFVETTGAAPGWFPGWYRTFLYHLLVWRGGFDGERSSAAALKTAGRSDVPLLLIHGTGDTLIPYAHSQELAEVYTQAGGQPELHIVKDAGHARVWNADPAAFEARLDTFFAAALRDR